MTDLTTNYLGMNLRSPLVVSPCPLCADLENLRRIEGAGAGAVVLHSLFEEQISLDSTYLNHGLELGAESYAESLSYLPEMDDYKLGPEEYLEHIAKAKAALSIPVIASLNGTSAGGWTSFARKMEAAGADGLELNVYFMPTDPDVPSYDVERSYLDLIAQVRAAVNIPIAVKLGPHFTALANFARSAEMAGADSLVLFNRFFQPDLDLERLEVTPNLQLSTSDELRMRLRWVAILYDRIGVDLALTGGVHTGEDAVKGIAAGATVVMMTSALLKKGIDHLAHVQGGLVHWMEEQGYTSVEELRGCMSQRSVADPAAFERANYLKVLSSYAPKLRY